MRIALQWGPKDVIPQLTCDSPRATRAAALNSNDMKYGPKWNECPSRFSDVGFSPREFTSYAYTCMPSFVQLKCSLYNNADLICSSLFPSRGWNNSRESGLKSFLPGVNELDEIFSSCAISF